MNNKVKYAIALGAFVIFTYVGYRLLPKDEIVIQSDVPQIEEKKFYVHIEGCVHNPGIVEIEPGTRVYELIKMAGGETDEADLSKVNLASILADAQKVYVPPKVATSSEPGYSSNLVNINTATLQELQSLDGIGPSMAQKIIDYREKQGYFNSIEDIMNVGGIGKSKFEKIQDNIVT